MIIRRLIILSDHVENGFGKISPLKIATISNDKAERIEINHTGFTRILSIFPTCSHSERFLKNFATSNLIEDGF